MKKLKSANLYKEACRYLVGGVNSPVRAFKSVGGSPKFIAKASGSKIYDVDSNKYIDYVCSWGAIILGHAYPKVVSEVKKNLKNGSSFGAPTILETKLAKLICKVFTSIEMVRLVSSGTEAVMSAIRLARGYTSKSKVIKFAGCYHGHVDYLLVSAGSGAMTFGKPNSEGVLADFTKHTIVLPYNNIDILKDTIKKYHSEIACLIIEPVCGNMGVVLPKEGFLKEVEKLCKQYKIILIFDEIISGFRIAKNGIQGLYGIKPDITCLGKIIGGGFHLAAYGGRKEIMQNLSPIGSVYQAGTLSGNPIAVTAGLKTLEILLEKDEYKSINNKTKILCTALKENARKSGIDITINQIGSMFTVFFTNLDIFDFESANKVDAKFYRRYFHSMLNEKIYMPPSQFEANFLTFSHTWDDIEKTVTANKKALKSLWSGGKNINHKGKNYEFRKYL